MGAEEGDEAEMFEAPDLALLLQDADQDDPFILALTGASHGPQAALSGCVDASKPCACACETTLVRRSGGRNSMGASSAAIVQVRTVGSAKGCCVLNKMCLQVATARPRLRPALSTSTRRMRWST